MAAIMSYIRSIPALLIALIGLVAPSVAAGYGALTADSAPAVLAVADGAGVPHYTPCEKQEGKLLLPCHPDPGILAAAVAERVWTPAKVLRPAAAAARRTPAPSADPPPPRRA